MAKNYLAAFAIAFVALALLFAGCVKPESGPVGPSVPSGPSGTTLAPSASASAAAGMKTFSSYDEIYQFLKTAGGSSGYYGGTRDGMMVDMAVGKAIAPTAAPAAGENAAGSQSSSDYSQTNVQVAGVDEADFVKNDGKYIYIAKNEYNYGNYRYNPFGSSSQGSVKIIDAYPASSMKQVGEITFEGSVSQIFVYKDKLVVFGSVYVPYYYPQPLSANVRCMDCIMPPYYSSNFAFMRVYDITDRASPKLVKRIEVKGSYSDARMIDGKVYAIFSDYASQDYPIPILRVDGTSKEIAPSQISYFDYPDSGYNYNVLTGIDLNDLSKEESRKVVLMGYSQNLYVSKDNMYVTFTRYDYYDPAWKVYNEVFSPYFDSATKSRMAEIDAMNISAWRKEKLKSNEAMYFMQNKIYNPLDLSINSTLRDELSAKLQAKQSELSQPTRSDEKTEIHKFALDSSFTYGGQGEVPGHVLNQFSMDEYEGNFRIATTINANWGTNEKSSNNMYVLDSGMKLIGSLANLAEGESIYSVRFMGSRAYMVTFKKVDPLFAIDLSDPASPKVMGQLKIPGYSDYLHPYDETHLIGLGKGAEADENGGDFSWYQGVKLSLFDVSDITAPKEVAKYEIGDRGTDSYALSEHKAFTFSKEKGVLIIPITLAKIDPSQYPNGVTPSSYGSYVFQGAYVFNVSLDSGFSLRGTVSHTSEPFANKRYGYYWGNTNVQRSIYMDNFLYTISGAYLKANDLTTLAPLASIQLGNETTYGGYYY